MAVKMTALVIIFIISVGFLVWYRQKIRLRWNLAFPLRLVVIGLVLLGYYTVTVEENEVGKVPQEILLLDVSDSIDPQEALDSRVSTLAWINEKPGRSVIVFGERSAVLLTEEWPEVISTASDLRSALTLAARILSGSAGRIVVATDGAVEDSHEVENDLTRILSRGSKIDFIVLQGRNSPDDLYVGEIIGPKGTWQNSDLVIGLPIYAPRTGVAHLSLTINGESQETIPVEVSPGLKTYPLRINSGRSGILLVGATVNWEGDSFSQNNTVFAAYEIYPPLKVLLVSPDTSEAGRLLDSLEAEGIEIDIVSPDELTTSLTELLDYQAILIFNLLAREISYEQMLGLETFVVNFGRSLVFLGGRNSFNLGGYENTLLAPLLPIDLAPPERIERVPATYVMVLDRSGSMEQDEESDVSPIALTREAAIRAIESLRPDDYFGVLTFSSKTEWVVEVSEVGGGMNLRIAQDAVSQIQTGGGTMISQALEEAITVLVNQKPTAYMHILMMTDGKSEDEEDTLQKFSVLAEIARRQNITISTIGLGNKSDTQTLSFIAQEGNGRFYEVLDPTDLPGVMVAESKAAHSENIQIGLTNLIPGIDNHPALRNFIVGEFPGVQGYNAVSSKADLGAEDILLSGNFGDPVLSTWQVGLGHVTTWTSDMGIEWVPDMDIWLREGEFWKQIIEYTLPDPTFDLAEIEINMDSAEMNFDLRVYDFDGMPVSNLAPRFVYADFNKKPVQFSMQEIAVGQYRAVVPRLKADGYRGAVLFSLDDQEWEVAVPFVVNYPAEWRFDYTGVGAKNIQRWVDQLDGKETSFELELNPEVETGWLDSVDRYRILVILVIILWPVEIAIRRWKMPWR